MKCQSLSLICAISRPSLSRSPVSNKNKSGKIKSQNYLTKANESRGTRKAKYTKNNEMPRHARRPEYKVSRYRWLIANTLSLNLRNFMIFLILFSEHHRQYQGAKRTQIKTRRKKTTKPRTKGFKREHTTRMRIKK